jgi:hypothetical protein
MPTGGYDLYNIIAYWQDIGIYDIVLPFLLVFSISYAVLQKIKLFGKEAKRVNIIIAFVLGLLFLQNSYLTFTLQRFLPNVSLILIIFLIGLLLVGVFVGEKEWAGGGATIAAFVVSIVALIIAFTADFGPGYGLFEWWNLASPGTRGSIWLIIAVVAVMVIVTFEQKKS